MSERVVLLPPLDSKKLEWIHIAAFAGIGAMGVLWWMTGLFFGAGQLKETMDAWWEVAALVVATIVVHELMHIAALKLASPTVPVQVRFIKGIPTVAPTVSPLKIPYVVAAVAPFLGLTVVPFLAALTGLIPPAFMKYAALLSILNAGGSMMDLRIFQVVLTKAPAGSVISYDDTEGYVAEARTD